MTTKMRIYNTQELPSAFNGRLKALKKYINNKNQSRLPALWGVHVFWRNGLLYGATTNLEKTAVALLGHADSTSNSDGFIVTPPFIEYMAELEGESVEFESHMNGKWFLSVKSRGGFSRTATFKTLDGIEFPVVNFKEDDFGEDGVLILRADGVSVSEPKLFYRQQAYVKKDKMKIDYQIPYIGAEYTSDKFDGYSFIYTKDGSIIETKSGLSCGSCATDGDLSTIVLQRLQSIKDLYRDNPPSQAHIAEDDTPYAFYSKIATFVGKFVKSDFEGDASQIWGCLKKPKKNGQKEWAAFLAEVERIMPTLVEIQKARDESNKG